MHGKYKVIWLFAGLMILAVASLISLELFRSNTNSVTESVHDGSNSTANTRLLIFGDLFWGRAVDKWARQSGEGPAYTFSGLSSFNREDYDFWAANLECPITDNGINWQEQISQLKFNCPPEYLNEAKTWFDVFSLANNHTMNQGGQTGLEETRQFLDEHGIQYFGHYDNSVKEDTCEVISLPASIGDKNIQVPVAWCGFHTVFRTLTDEEIEVISDYAKYFPTIVFAHSGAEYQPKHGNLTQQQFHKVVDAGADLVVATHPHWVQDTEVYKDTLIVYSLGNFIFDQFEYEETRGVGLDVSMELSGRALDKLMKLKGCDKYKDKCLEQASNAELSKPDIEFNFDIVPVDGTNRLTKRGGQALLADLLKRLNWEKTLSDLQ